MGLFLHLNKLEYLKKIKDILLDGKELANWISKKLGGELQSEISPQYETQFLAQNQIEKRFGKNFIKQIGGIYFGSDVCEFLQPSLIELKKAVEIFSQLKKEKYLQKNSQFILVTSWYANENVRKQLQENLKWLNKEGKKILRQNMIEIIINDFGTYNFIKKEKLQLQPVLGRLLVKTFKTAWIDQFGLEKVVNVPGELIKNKSHEEIQKIKQNIANGQEEGLQQSSLSNPYFENFLQKKQIMRTGIDYQENRENLFKGNKVLDIYYPYSVVTCGRKCDVRGLKEQSCAFYSSSKPCARWCNKYEMQISGQNNTQTMLSGNTIYKKQINLNLNQSNISKLSRIIWSPFI